MQRAAGTSKFPNYVLLLLTCVLIQSVGVGVTWLVSIRRQPQLKQEHYGAKMTGTSNPPTPVQEEDDEESEAIKTEEPEYDISDEARALAEELAKIKVEQPTNVIQDQEHFNPADFPESYKENIPKEILVLAYAENFRRQYVHLYRDRKPLFLKPVNECRIEKFVCTTIRPTQLPYQELNDWDGAAEFVSDYLNFVNLTPPYELPVQLLSPTTIIKRQKGNCFEYSTLLCSLLLAAGYDAYVVSGYASKETCLMDESREICPLLKKIEEQSLSDPPPEMLLKQRVCWNIEREKNRQAILKKRRGTSDTPTKKTEEQKKYTVKPPKDLQSKFELKQEERRQKAIAEEEAKKRIAEEKALAKDNPYVTSKELEMPPEDPLYGLRIHAWVLVLEGKREVPEAFFIEPFTGIAHPINSSNYLGIESIWNNTNYWVNMQDCSEGVAYMKYDLGDCTQWEFMFPNTEKPLLSLPLEEPDLMDGFDDDEEEEVVKQLDMPPSWVYAIDVSLKDFQMRCPMGKKTKYYKRVKLEKFAHYLIKDGLVCRLSIYNDKDVTDLVQVKEYYEHREDKLKERYFTHTSGWVSEYYKPGRERGLKEHYYRSSAPGIENDRTMIFYSEARVDGLERRIETPTEMTEHYVDRKDYLSYRNVEFTTRPKKFGPAESNTPRPIVKMVERYHPDPEKEANETISEVVFNIIDEKIQITYHTENNKISASVREFTKPTNTDEKGGLMFLSADMHSTFQVDPIQPPKKQVELYNTLMDLLKAEDTCRERVRASEAEVQDILDDRMKEEAISELDISVYDTMRNEKAKKHRKELVRLQLEDKLRKQEMELDYLAPFLTQIGNPEKLTRSQASKLKEDCLADLKKRLIDKANLIQARFEKETQELQKKQAWYQQNQMSMMKDDEEEYLSYCSDAMFRIHILELRLNRHKETAPQKYMALERDIRTDPRLCEFF